MRSKNFRASHFVCRRRRFRDVSDAQTRRVEMWWTPKRKPSLQPSAFSTSPIDVSRCVSLTFRGCISLTVSYLCGSFNQKPIFHFLKYISSFICKGQTHFPLEKMGKLQNLFIKVVFYHTFSFFTCSRLSIFLRFEIWLGFPITTIVSPTSNCHMEPGFL